MPCRFTTIVVTAAAGISTEPTEKFDFSGAFVAASSYTFQPSK